MEFKIEGLRGLPLWGLLVVLLLAAGLPATAAPEATPAAGAREQSAEPNSRRAHGSYMGRPAAQRIVGSAAKADRVAGGRLAQHPSAAPPPRSPASASGRRVLRDKAAAHPGDSEQQARDNGNDLPEGGCATWRVQGSPNVGSRSNTLWDVEALAANNAWAVGDYYDEAESRYKVQIQRWDGSAWTVATSGILGTLQAVEAVSANDVWP